MDGRQEFLQQVLAVTGRNTLHGHPRVLPSTLHPFEHCEPSVLGAPAPAGSAIRRVGRPPARAGPDRGPLRPARVRMGLRDLILKQWSRV
ncbi:hypothetical protein Scani_42630 [Streptomyces caniferus]|uniref:Uncharacterized protein n=1 Tax=Streptomyces caniferus TaxID=285557 RepID=A0A640SEI7_9ACTN|nr:hypothetical protein Scani_42630 [Streptomyces caniferus]